MEYCCKRALAGAKPVERRNVLATGTPLPNPLCGIVSDFADSDLDALRKLDPEHDAPLIRVKVVHDDEFPMLCECIETRWTITQILPNIVTLSCGNVYEPLLHWILMIFPAFGTSAPHDMQISLMSEHKGLIIDWDDQRLAAFEIKDFGYGKK